MPFPPLRSLHCLPLALVSAVFLLSGCTGEDASSVSAPKVPDLAAQSAAGNGAPPDRRPATVTIRGQDADETIQRWQPPAVTLDEDDLGQARRDAARALQEGRLYREATDAIPLYLAIARLRPDDAVATRGLRQARLQLRRQVNALLAQPHQQRQALAEATQMALVLLTLAPEDEDVRALQARVELAQRVVAFNRAGEDDLRAGQLGEDGDGALPNFREALALAPDNSRARQGIAAVESGLIRRAELAAQAADFSGAGQWLAEAARVRDASPAIADALDRVEQIRSAQIIALRDAGLRDLRTPQGLKSARQRLEQALRIALPGDPVVAQLRLRLDLATHYGSFRPGQVFNDALSSGTRGPQMIVIPHGGFQMGAGEAEPGASDAERPAHYVRFERGFAMSITEVTVAQFRQFVLATGTRPRAVRRGHSVVYDERSGNFIRRSGVDWQSGYDGSRAADDMPVTHVSVRDAENYANWLSEQTGRFYRLPSEAEFEYVLRAGGSGRYPWGNDGVPPENSGNFTGSLDVSASGRHWNNAFIGYGDGYWGPAPAGRFSPNAWGVHDIAGNVSEWVGDCWHSSYRRAPADGVTWFNPGCRQRVIRGGSWSNAPDQTRAAWRQSQDSDTTSARIGFRLVRGI